MDGEQDFFNPTVMDGGEDDEEAKRILKERKEEAELYQEWVDSQLNGVCSAGCSRNYSSVTRYGRYGWVVRGYYTLNDGSKDDAFHEAYF